MSHAQPGYRFSNLARQASASCGAPQRVEEAHQVPLISEFASKPWNVMSGRNLRTWYLWRGNGGRQLAPRRSTRAGSDAREVYSGRSSAEEDYLEWAGRAERLVEDLVLLGELAKGRLCRVGCARGLLGVGGGSGALGGLALLAVFCHCFSSVG